MVGHADMAFFEIDDSSGNPLIVIIRTRFPLFLFGARLVATAACHLIRIGVPVAGVKT